MTTASPCKTRHSQLVRLTARVTILALVASLLPANASPSAPTSQASIDSYTPPDLRVEAPVSAREVLLCVVVAVADPFWLTKSAFGELLSHTGPDPQPYAFAGEPLDPNSGWQYHRARWMDPRVGRFAGMDLHRGSAHDPSSLHVYLYGFADPPNRRDPSGRIPIGLIPAAVGRAVHDEIGRDFVRKMGGFANYFPIFTILDVDPSTCVPLPFVCGLKPDLVNPDPETAEVYEIKPAHLYTVGTVELFGYLGILDINDPQRRSWHFGSSYQPPGYIYVPDYGGWDVLVSPPLNGVIAYVPLSRVGTKATVAGLATIAIKASVAALASLQLRLAFGF